MEDELAARLSQLNKQELKTVLERVAAQNGGDVAAFLAPILAKDPLGALAKARMALIAWSEQEEAQLTKKRKLFYALEVEDIIRRVAGETALTGDE